MESPLKKISELGQSVWCDNLSRELIESGELKKLIEQDGISGVTSNPTIFEKAIGRQKSYESELHELVDQGKTVYEIYEGLVIRDIRSAAELLKPVYDASDGNDGFVSLEAPPEMAYDKAKTEEEVQRLVDEVERENLMIKVPATPQGIKALRELIGKGHNINVTLIFSLDQYRDTANAYVEGLESLVESGGDPSKVSSVASFFVSRVDTIIDSRLDEINDTQKADQAADLKGKAAIANARLAYSIYKDIFEGERFGALREKGAKPQRVLWASTSSKNPDYPDTYYVEALIGPNTVNTMPEVTMEAFRDHGVPELRLEENLEESRDVFRRLEEVGVNVDAAMEELLEKGVKSFADSFDDLLDGISAKRTRLLRGWGHRSASLGELKPIVDETLLAFDKEKLGISIWEHDYSVWTDDPKEGREISQRLGWLNAVSTMAPEIPKLKAFAKELIDSGIEKAALLGMGGSSLASEVFQQCFGKGENGVDLKVLDTTVPASILKFDETINIEKTLFIVSSKSGSTIEAQSLFKHYWNMMKDALGEKAGDNFIAITDPGTSLSELGHERSFRKVFLNPPDIGGRFSGLSYFGLVPAALLDLDLERLMMRASQATEASGPNVPALENPGMWLGAILGEGANRGFDKVTLLASPSIASFGLWLEQLLAESVGKKGRGIIPVDSEVPAAPEIYEADRIFVYLRSDDEAGFDDHVSGLENAGHKVVTLRIHNPYDLGREMFRWEFATSIAGKVLGVNPFDQPDVQSAKDITGEMLDRFIRDGELPDIEKLTVDSEELGKELSSLFETVKSGDYMAFNAFTPPSQEVVDHIQRMRSHLLNKYKIATTMGFGPRYLHSTGQAHKGGPNTGLFLVITMDDSQDVAIPGEDYSFSVLKGAQGIGDFKALKSRNRRALRVHLRDLSEMEKLAGAVEAL
jgi:transaldolase/glucose-6-phosphate isomerase